MTIKEIVGRRCANIITILLLGLNGVIMTACHGSDEPDAPKGPAKMAVLVYAVASNDLYSSLVSDKEEMLEGASYVNLDDYSWMVYEVTPSDKEARLLEVVKTPEGKCDFKAVKTYDREVYSTDPARIAQVIADFEELRDAEHRGLVLWSHGTGMDPATNEHAALRTATTESQPVREVYSFGVDIDRDKNPNYKDKTNIDELASAIPDGLFDFIWFDACYMSGIETIYQLRNKCDTFVGYATEVYGPGMPYHLTLPYMLRETPDLTGGAKAFFDYYDNSNLRAATVAVVNTSALEEVADYCREALPGGEVPSSYILQCYTRNSTGPFYDFGQVVRLMAASNETAPDVSDFEAAMQKAVVYKMATPYDFNSRPRPIDPANFSGINCHLFDPQVTSAKNTFYRTLDWYEAVYGK